MKKIQLSDGMPNDIRRTEISTKAKELLDNTKKIM